MVREAEAHADEDKRRKELVEVRNQADAAIYAAEKALNDPTARVPADVKTDMEQAISALRDAIKGEDLQRIKQATERLAQASMRLGEAASRAGEQGGTPGSEEKPDVVDAEFEEVDKRNRKTGS
jgi:molecular chaperone DnaK